MDFLKNNKRFDFTYGGKPFSEYACEVTQEETAQGVTTRYHLPDGLVITNVAVKKGEAYEWVNWLENTADAPTPIISDLYDACVALPMPKEEPLAWTAFQPLFDEITTVYAPIGSTWRFDEFAAFPDRSELNRFHGHLPAGTSKTYATDGGRSSQKQAPYFNVHKDGKGYIFAIGWTGQWNCTLERTTDSILVKTKIEDTNFRLLPGEKIRTSSFVMMPYEGTVEQSQNKWRRLVREHYSLIGQQGREAVGPLCAGVWGGMETSAVLERIDAIRRNELPFEYIWMDAGWYGGNTKPTPDEFEGDWGDHTGDWRVSPLIHPGGLRDVAQAVHEAGMKFLLWFEPERVRRGTPIVSDHPEYFIFPQDEQNQNLLLNLGYEPAWQYCFDTLSQRIEQIGIDCYRQDFNMPPIDFWRKADTEDRRGMTEIRHINGLYRLWDALLEKFPHLLIDNCAAGGRRLDIEMMRRSIPLWRSDYQCPANFLPEGSQCHNLSFNTWMPYSGTSSGRIYDTYRFRSAYSPAMTTNYTFSQRETFGDDPEKMAWLKGMLEEYRRVRPYLSEDFYALTQVSDRNDVWCAAQFHRPEQGDGIVQVFRRADSPYQTASFLLRGIDRTASYLITDADGGAPVCLSGEQLCDGGFAVEMPEKRSAKIYFYKKG